MPHQPVSKEEKEAIAQQIARLASLTPVIEDQNFYLRIMEFIFPMIEKHEITDKLENGTYTTLVKKRSAQAILTDVFDIAVLVKRLLNKK